MNPGAAHQRWFVLEEGNLACYKPNRTVRPVRPHCDTPRNARALSLPALLPVPCRYHLLAHAVSAGGAAQCHTADVPTAGPQDDDSGVEIREVPLDVDATDIRAAPLCDCWGVRGSCALGVWRCHRGWQWVAVLGGASLGERLSDIPWAGQ